MKKKKKERKKKRKGKEIITVLSFGTICALQRGVSVTKDVDMPRGNALFSLYRDSFFLLFSSTRKRDPRDGLSGAKTVCQPRFSGHYWSLLAVIAGLGTPPAVYLSQIYA